MSHPFTYTQIDETTTFREFAYMAVSQMALGAKKSTKQDLTSRLTRLLLPHFGNLEIKNITPLLIERWQSDLSITKGVDMTRRTKQLLKNILDRAIVYQLITENPTSSTSKIKGRRAEPREIYSKHEVSLMLKGSDKWLNLFILTMVSLGLRSGEMINIKFSDIDWINKKIHIQGNIKYGKFSLPKSGLTRWVDIPTHLMAEFEKAYKARIESNPNADYIFITDKGFYWSDSSYITRRHFKPLLKRLKIKYKGLYSLRHTYATLSLQGGQKIAYISKQLGHSDIKTTLDYYIKYLYDEEDLNKANKILAF